MGSHSSIRKNPQFDTGKSQYVPCNGCTACCKKELILLQPEFGDRVENYITVPSINPLTGEFAYALDHKANGDCIYLEDNGCSIHGRAPAHCREFDCRKFYLSLGTRADRRRLLKRGHLDHGVFAAAKERLHTLTEADIAEVNQMGKSSFVRLSDARS